MCITKLSDPGTVTAKEAYIYARDKLGKKWGEIGRPEMDDLINSHPKYKILYKDLSKFVTGKLKAKIFNEQQKQKKKELEEEPARSRCIRIIEEYVELLHKSKHPRTTAIKAYMKCLAWLKSSSEDLILIQPPKGIGPISFADMKEIVKTGNLNKKNKLRRILIKSGVINND